MKRLLHVVLLSFGLLICSQTKGFTIYCQANVKHQANVLKDKKCLFKTGVDGAGKVIAVTLFTEKKEKVALFYMSNGFWFPDISKIELPNNLFDKIIEKCDESDFKDKDFKDIYENPVLDNKRLIKLYLDLIVYVEDIGKFLPMTSLVFYDKDISSNEKTCSIDYNMSKEDIERVLVNQELSSDDVVKSKILRMFWSDYTTQNRVHFWPFYVKNGVSYPGCPIGRKFSSFSCLCGHRFDGMEESDGSIVLCVNSWLYEPCDEVLIKKYYLVRRIYERGKDGNWQMVPPRQKPEYLMDTKKHQAKESGKTDR